MPRHVLALALVALCACNRSPRATADTTSALTTAGVGPVRIGMRSVEARAALKLPPAQNLQPMVGCGYLDVKGSPLHVDAMLIDGIVERVEARDSTIATAAGARVGDPESKILELYRGRVRVEPHKYLTPDGHYLVVTALGDTTSQLIFETDGKRVLTIRAGRLPAVAYVERCG